ncbi:MAG: nucleotide exchange factor GrpE [Candidatus Bipolaricaulia bacterium]
MEEMKMEEEKKKEEESRAAADKQEELQAQIEGYIDRIKHIQADFENYKKRVARERAELERLVEDRVILKFIPIYDNLERAFRSFNHNNDKDSFIEGMERIFSQFRYLLESEGVEPIEALGRQFDPMLHEALLTVEHDGEPNIVLEEFERGYLRRGRLLRPSRVKVSRAKSKEKVESAGEGKEGEDG